MSNFTGKNNKAFPRASARNILNKNIMNEFIDNNNSEIITSIVTLLITAIFRHFEKKRLKKKNNE